MKYRAARAMRIMAISALTGVALMQAPAWGQGASPSSVQQQFDAASAMLASEQWAEALAAFEALEQRLAKNKTSGSLAIVRVRKGEALLRLGRSEEAAAALKIGLAHLSSDASLAEDRYLAQIGLAQISEQALDHRNAASLYRDAEAAASTSGQKVRAIGGLARTSMFHDGETALASAERGLALASDDTKLAASFRTLRGRALLNLGRLDEAQGELKQALKALGGLTLKVDFNDISARSDIALVSLLLNKHNQAREYLAYTGAGRTRKDFAPPTEMSTPSCDETGLSPDDVAVIQLAVGDDGSVLSATPVYSSRQGDAALEFARAGLKWSWAPEKAAEIEPLLRLTTRVEMRCSTATKRPPVIGLLAGEVTDWLGSHGLSEPDFENTGHAGNRSAVDALGALEAKGEGTTLAAFPLLVALARSPLIGLEQKVDYLSRATAIAEAEKAPASVRAYLAVNKAMTEAASNATRRSWRPADLAPLLADPAIAADVRAASTIRLLIADQLPRKSKIGDIKALLTAIRDVPGLDPNDPVRIGAMVRLASVEMASGNLDAARSAYEATGLTAQQCALVDAKPALQRVPNGTNAFPMEAMQWGFEGWTANEFDVGADGRTQNMRTVAAYPPFVFSKASTTMIGGARFTQTYRPEGGLGCGGASERVVFRLPD